MEFNCENCGWSKVVGSPIFCEYSEKRTFRENCCEAWKPKNNPITNADRIRAMTDEELAEFMTKGCDDRECPDISFPADTQIAKDASNEQCRKCWLDWLKQGVESDG